MATSDQRDRLANLSPEKRALLLKMLREQQRPAERAEAIPRRSDDGPPPCSFAQERLWFADQLEPDSPLYNITLAVDLHGVVDPTLLERALNEILRRHEALRTTFTAEDGRPVQAIAPCLALDLPIADLRDLPAAAREAERQRLASELARRGFDLAGGPLLRALLIQTGEAKQTLVMVLHHIVSDGWSIDLLVRELAALYEAFATGQPSPLPELALQYADYAVWQRAWLNGDRLHSQLDYWRRQLADAPAVLDLPTDRPRPPVQTHRGAAHAFELPPELASTLESVCRGEGVTAFQALLAAFQALLHRYTGQEQVVVGSPIAGRTRAEIEPLIGLFVNTLVLHTDLSGNPTFRDLLARVREVTLGAYAHQDLPFEKLVEALQPERSLSHSPLYQVVFTFDPSRPELPRIAGAPIRTEEVDTGTAKFDLLLALAADRPALRGEIEYNADLFDAATIARLAGHFTTLLAGALSDPETRLDNLPLLTEAERRQLEAWNATAQGYRAGVCLHQLIAAQAAETPDQPAVLYRDDRLSHAELDRRANQLAHELRARGVGPEERVAICMDRSVDLIVAVLGALKAGGAYVPIDVTNPRERLSYMLNDSRARVVLTQQRFTEILPLDPERTLCLDRDADVIARHPTDPPPDETRPINTAYVIYTSGSTGWPKGVAVQHEGVVSFVDDSNGRVPLGVGDVHALWTNMSFDVSVYDVFAALLTGGTLDIVPDDVRPVSTAFFDWMAERRIASTYTPPFMLGDLPAWLERNPGRLRLKKMMVGVEPIPEQLLVRTSRQVPGLRILNGYGPTEATVACTMYPIDLDSTHERNAPIGRPIGNTRIHLLDRGMQPVPVGVPGELYVGGVGLARGYLERPDLTADRFVPNPFADDPGERLYRTGDLARYLSDGNIEFLGRIDHQIKLRGFRIELGEIEAALEGRDEVREALVIAREDVPGDKRLVAYLVLADGATLPTASVLRAYLKERLPEYMVPAAYVPLERLPLSPNGKLDRKALPAPPTDRAEGEAAHAPPSSDLERTIAAAWCEVLGLQRVGVTDNFFDLGGHSLLVVRLQTRLRELLGRNLSIVELFQHSTVAALAQHIGRAEPDVTAIQQGQERAATRLELRAQRRDARLRRPGPGA